MVHKLFIERYPIEMLFGFWGCFSNLDIELFSNNWHAECFDDKTGYKSLVINSDRYRRIEIGVKGTLHYLFMSNGDGTTGDG